jgi:D-glycero-alpha-D-manno-heptose 1-phosphate guanylyltransferase
VIDAVVLAGGLGTRLRPVVSDVPKPMAPVNGRPFLELLLGYWKAQGVRRFILSIGHLAEKIVRHFGAQWQGAEISYAHETRPLGTGGGLLLAAPLVRSEELLVLNGDTFFAVDLEGLARFHREHQADCTISLFHTDDAKRYMGLGIAEDGRVRELAASGSGVANGGVYVFNAQTLRDLAWQRGQKASLEADLLPEGLRSGWRVFGRRCDAAFIDIGVPEDYRRAADVIGEPT